MVGWWDFESKFLQNLCKILLEIKDLEITSKSDLLNQIDFYEYIASIITEITIKVVHVKTAITSTILFPIIHFHKTNSQSTVRLVILTQTILTQNPHHLHFHYRIRMK